MECLGGPHESGKAPQRQTYESVDEAFARLDSLLERPLEVVAKGAKYMVVSCDYDMGAPAATVAAGSSTSTPKGRSVSLRISRIASRSSSTV